MNEVSAFCVINITSFEGIFGDLHSEITQQKTSRFFTFAVALKGKPVPALVLAGFTPAPPEQPGTSRSTPQPDRPSGPLLRVDATNSSPTSTRQAREAETIRPRWARLQQLPPKSGTAAQIGRAETTARLPKVEQSRVARRDTEEQPPRWRRRWSLQAAAATAASADLRAETV